MPLVLEKMFHCDFRIGFLNINRYLNRECFDFNHSLGRLPYFKHHNETSRPSLSYQLFDLLSLFIWHAHITQFNSFNVKENSMPMLQTIIKHASFHIKPYNEKSLTMKAQNQFCYNNILYLVFLQNVSFKYVWHITAMH